jgi:hypothetical protein
MKVPLWKTRARPQQPRSTGTFEPCSDMWRTPVPPRWKEREPTEVREPAPHQQLPPIMKRVTFSTQGSGRTQAQAASVVEDPGSPGLFRLSKLTQNSILATGVLALSLTCLVGNIAGDLANVMSTENPISTEQPYKNLNPLLGASRLAVQGLKNRQRGQGLVSSGGEGSPGWILRD